jgi:hypothetical protein
MPRANRLNFVTWLRLAATIRDWKQITAFLQKPYDRAVSIATCGTTNIGAASNFRVVAR